MDGDLQLKNDMLSDVLAEARKLTHSTLMSSTNPDNPRMSVLFKLTQQTSVSELEGYLKDLGFEEESLSDLTTTQLNTLKFYVDNDKDLRRDRAYRRLRNE